MHAEGTLNGRTFKSNEYYSQNGNIASAIVIDGSRRGQIINDYSRNLGLFISKSQENKS